MNPSPKTHTTAETRDALVRTDEPRPLPITKSGGARATNNVNMPEDNPNSNEANSRRDALVTSRVWLGDGALDLRCGDCMDLMRETPDKHYDLAIVDPPYGIGRDGSARTTGKHGGRKAHAFKGWDRKPPGADYFRELYRVSKDQIIWGANYYPGHLPKSMGWIFWDKGQRICNSDGELAFTSFNRALRVVEMNRVALLKEGTIHPTQKPVALYSWLLANYAKPGMRILDTHLGSGSIAIACHQHGMRLTATEIDPDYFAEAVARIRRETRQQNLFT